MCKGGETEGGDGDTKTSASGPKNPGLPPHSNDKLPFQRQSN